MIKGLLTSLKYIVAIGISLVLIAIIAREVLFVGAIKPVVELPDVPIIDMHVHIAGLGYGDSGCFISDELRDSYKFDYYISSFGVSEQEIIEQGDQIVVQHVAETVAESSYVDGAIVLAMDGVMDENGLLDRNKTQVYIPNDYVAEQTALYPMLYFGASINPYRIDALERLDKVKRQGTKLIKWIPNIQHIDPADKRLIPFYNKMRALGLPLLSHAGQERSFGDAIDKYGDPQRLRLPLSLGVTVIAGHIATTGETEQQSNYQRILPMFEQYPNLYTDTSSLTQINKLGYLDKALIDPRLEGRMLYGSDYPLVNMVLVSPYYFPLNLTFEQSVEINNIANPWDRDIALKQALGMHKEVFANSYKLLNH